VPLPGVEAERGELWRSDNAGATWQVVSYDRELAGRTQYYTRMVVAPDHPDEAYFLASSFSKTQDGGKTTIDVPFTGWPGWDHHDMWIDPTNGNRMVVGSDCCVSISVNRGQTWIQSPLPVAQMYHVTVDNQIPYWSTATGRTVLGERAEQQQDRRDLRSGSITCGNVDHGRRRGERLGDARSRGSEHRGSERRAPVVAVGSW
jgi:hypothetical protein